MSRNIPEVKDEDIFINPNTITNKIKGKKLRKKIYDNSVKIEIKVVDESMGLGFGLTTKALHFVYYRTTDIDKEISKDIVSSVGNVIRKHYDYGTCYHYWKDNK